MGSNYWFGTWQRELVFGFFVNGFFREVFTSGLDLQENTWYHLAASLAKVLIVTDGRPALRDAILHDNAARLLRLPRTG